MAVDTEDKRRSVQGVFPVPDGTIDVDDRRRTPGIYSFGGGGGSADTGAGGVTPFRRFRRALGLR